jgi:hypothetical protein
MLYMSQRHFFAFNKWSKKILATWLIQFVDKGLHYVQKGYRIRA